MRLEPTTPQSQVKDLNAIEPLRSSFVQSDEYISSLINYYVKRFLIKLIFWAQNVPSELKANEKSANKQYLLDNPPKVRVTGQ